MASKNDDRSGTGDMESLEGVVPVTDSHGSPTAVSAEEPRGAEGRPDLAGVPPGPRTVPPRPGTGRGASGWTGGRVTALVIGCVLGLVSLGFLGAGGTVLWADRTQRDGGYITTDLHEFSTSASALVTDRTDLGTPWTGWAYAPALLDKVRIRVTPVNSNQAVFVGIAPSAQVDRYLAGVSHTVITDIWSNGQEFVGGARSPSAPGAQDFWVASSSGRGTRTVEWDPTNGSWTVVVMNVEGQPGIDVRADLGATIPSLLWVAVGLLIAGAVFLAGALLLIVIPIRRVSRTRTA